MNEVLKKILNVGENQNGYIIILDLLNLFSLALIGGAIIELIDSVTIIRDGEKISGDYGTLDTKNNSYKIKSEKQTKVKVVIQNNEQ